jgi:hypothetical protein
MLKNYVLATILLGGLSGTNARLLRVASWGEKSVDEGKEEYVYDKRKGGICKTKEMDECTI